MIIPTKQATALRRLYDKSGGATAHNNYINQGHNGWTSGGIADNIESLGIIPADVYSVFLGTNDWWQGRPIGTIDDYRNQTGNQTFYGSFAIIINKLRSLNKDAKIILITPLQRVDFVYIHDKTNNAWGSYKDKNGQSLEMFANALINIAEPEHCKLVDLYHKSGINYNNLIKFKRLKDPAPAIIRTLNILILPASHLTPQQMNTLSKRSLGHDL
jgi:hypothetical protein